MRDTETKNKTIGRGKVIQALNVPLGLAKKFKVKCVEEELSPRSVVAVLVEKFCDGKIEGIDFASGMREIEKKYWGEGK